MPKPVNIISFYHYCPNCRNKLILQTIDKEFVKKCNSCNFVFWNNPKPVVSFLLYKSEKVLMIQRASEPFKDYWVLPGGFIGYKESAEEAIKRETKEEIGSNVLIQGIVGVYRIDNDPRGVHIDIIFQGTSDDKVNLSTEDKNWRFFSPTQLPKNIAYKHREAINDWHQKGSQYDKTNNF